MIISSHLILSYSFSSCVFPRPTFLHFCLFVLSFCATSSRYSVTYRHRGPRKRLGRVSPRVTGEERTQGETINLTLRQTRSSSSVWAGATPRRINFIRGRRKSSGIYQIKHIQPWTRRTTGCTNSRTSTCLIQGGVSWQEWASVEIMDTAERFCFK